MSTWNVTELCTHEVFDTKTILENMIASKLEGSGLLCKKGSSGGKTCRCCFIHLPDWLAESFNRLSFPSPLLRTQIHIQRTEGCDHMTCSQCNTNFCYRCGERYRQLRFFGDHTSNLSIFGCKYRYLPERPHLRRFVRGSVCGKYGTWPWGIFSGEVGSDSRTQKWNSHGNADHYQLAEWGLCPQTRGRYSLSLRVYNEKLTFLGRTVLYEPPSFVQNTNYSLLWKNVKLILNFCNLL